MTGLFLSGLAAQPGGERMDVSEAVARGLYDPEIAAADEYFSLAREPERPAFQMALDVARPAMAEANCDVSKVSALVYASIHRHGHPRLWSPASWLARHLHLPGSVPTLAIQQGCNGIMQAIVALAPSCLADPSRRVVLVGADRFEASGFDRWRSDYGLLYGDAAAAIVLSAENGFARILHLAIDGAPELEELHRDPAPSPEGPESWLTENDVRRSKKAFLARHGHDGFTAPLNAALARLRSGLLANPAWSGPVNWVFTPFVGTRIRATTYDAAFASLGRLSGWEIGRELGHLGTTDGWTGLSLLRAADVVRPGDRVLIVSAGVGFSCGLALIEFL